MEAKKILEMIETVDPYDTKTLDEIDARVWCFVYTPSARYLNHRKNPHGQRGYSLVQYEFPNELQASQQVFEEYTRSRDALKAIRPEYSCLEIFKAVNNSASVTLRNYSRVPHDTFHASAKTEELAELHAIIQAIEYEMSKG